MKTAKLVWQINGEERIIEENKPFALLNQRLQQLKKEPQYSRGKLKLKYYGND